MTFSRTARAGPPADPVDWSGVRDDPAGGHGADWAVGLSGGLLAAAAATLGLVALAASAGQAAQRPLNVFGATFARWLQEAESPALDNLYLDATLGGLALLLTAGALLGGLLALILSRLPDDHPLAWGLIWGLALAALARWVLGPAFDPLISLELGTRPLLVAGALYGLFLGLWLQVDREQVGPPARGAGRGPA